MMISKLFDYAFVLIEHHFFLYQSEFQLVCILPSGALPTYYGSVASLYTQWFDQIQLA